MSTTLKVVVSLLVLAGALAQCATPQTGGSSAPEKTTTRHAKQGKKKLTMQYCFYPHIPPDPYGCTFRFGKTCFVDLDRAKALVGKSHPAIGVDPGDDLVLCMSHDFRIQHFVEVKCKDLDSPVNLNASPFVTPGSATAAKAQTLSSAIQPDHAPACYSACFVDETGKAIDPHIVIPRINFIETESRTETDLCKQTSEERQPPK